jgi:ribosomal protein S18 acetylase RimI-like enzyme
VTTALAPAAFDLVLAARTDVEVLVDLVGAYHAFEGVESDPAARRQAVLSLIDNADLGRIWRITLEQATVGYIALCFGYSIEFAGKDAFVDEFFIDAAFRGRGIGHAVLGHVAAEARKLHIRALHLEVAKTNIGAQRLYARADFEARAKYYLMTRYL